MSFLGRSSPSTIFPIYLLPSIPFRRRRNPSTDSTSSSSTSSTSSSPTSPQPFLTGHISHLRCARCATDLCLTSQIISKGFTGRHGRAYLVSPFPTSPHLNNARNPHLPNLPNTHVAEPVPRQLVTGAHTVSDVTCASCGSMIGWKYAGAEEENQRYKVGKFILETKKTFVGSCWEGEGFGFGEQEVGDGEEVEFDSQDEDECEDLFAGVWSPGLAMKRRRAKKLEPNSSWRRN